MYKSHPNNAGDGNIFSAVGDFVNDAGLSSILANTSFNTGAWETMGINSIRIDDGYLIMCVPISITNTDELAAYMEGQKIVYKLATPIEIQLDGVELIEALEGVNTIYGDGDLEVTFNHDNAQVAHTHPDFKINPLLTAIPHETQPAVACIN